MLSTVRRAGVILKGGRFLSVQAKLPDLVTFYCSWIDHTHSILTLPIFSSTQPYDFGALEPVISAEIMQIHHSKHHNAYVTNLNLGMTKLEEAVAKGDTSSIISLQQAIKFNGGGHLNHSIFWQNLAPVGKGGGEMPSGDLIKSIEAQYGSLENLQTAMSNACVGVQGSGWGWLGYDKLSSKLVITTSANQDPLQATTGHIPLLGIGNDLFSKRHNSH